MNFDSAAKTLGVEVATIKAVAEVESNGSGFLPDGHPKILYERHIMYQRVSQKFGKAKADELVKKYPDLINPVATPASGYGTLSMQPGKLEKAAKFIDRDCALESCSWSAFQILGYHWKSLNYPSLQAFINAMYRDEDAHLDAFVRFLQNDPELIVALKNKDWAAFARRYNGSNYAKFSYDKKLASAYAKYR